MPHVPYVTGEGGVCVKTTRYHFHNCCRGSTNICSSYIKYETSLHVGRTLYSKHGYQFQLLLGYTCHELIILPYKGSAFKHVIRRNKENWMKLKGWIYFCGLRAVKSYLPNKTMTSWWVNILVTKGGFHLFLKAKHVASVGWPITLQDSNPVFWLVLSIYNLAA